jgi:hypothetical protein
VWDSDETRLARMLELGMAPCLVRLVPAFASKPLNDFLAVHGLNHTHKYTKIQEHPEKMCTQACTQNESKFLKPRNHAGLQAYFVSRCNIE